MEENKKRYFWLKLKEDYFNSPKIKKLRKIAGGDTYTIIYLKMQLLSISNSGIIEFEGIENNFAEELALKLDEMPEDVSLTLSYLQSQSLIESNDNRYLFIEANNNIGSECDSAERVRQFREKKHNMVISKLPKENKLRQKQFRAKQLCKEIKHIPKIDDYTNNIRYNGNYYVVFKRDKMRCICCDSTENLCCHHIDGYNENNSKNNYENKMIIVCRSCHQHIHNGKNIKNEILESVGYYDEYNKNNDECNGSVTSVKRSSISNILLSYSLSNSINDIIEKWIVYKKEKNSSYKPTGFKQFLTKLKKDIETNKYSDEYVIECFEYCMSQNYQGFFWNNGKQEKSNVNTFKKSSSRYGSERNYSEKEINNIFGDISDPNNINFRSEE